MWKLGELQQLGSIPNNSNPLPRIPFPCNMVVSAIWISGNIPTLNYNTYLTLTIFNFNGVTLELHSQDQLSLWLKTVQGYRIAWTMMVDVQRTPDNNSLSVSSNFQQPQKKVVIENIFYSDLDGFSHIIVFFVSPGNDSHFYNGRFPQSAISR